MQPLLNDYLLATGTYDRTPSPRQWRHIDRALTAAHSAGLQPSTLNQPSAPANAD